MSSTETDQRIPFGREMLKQFPIAPEYRNLNHGSFGTFPLSVQKVREEFQRKLDARPDTFLRYQYANQLADSRAAIGKYLNVPKNEVVYVKNATTGVNIVLRNLVYKPGDVIVYFSSVYGACELTIAYLAESTPLQARQVPLKFPCTHEDIVERFLEVVRLAREDGLKVKVCLLDTISAQPGVRMPFEKIVEKCREEGILSCIDGAHAVGQIPLDLAALNADFFVSNCHKWLYSPRASAVFHCPPRNQDLIRTAIPTSWGFEPLPNILADSLPDVSGPNTPGPMPPANVGTGTDPDPNAKTPFEALFDYVGTNDDTPYLCTPAVLHFREVVCGGEQRIIDYIENLAWDAGNLVAKILGTEVLCEPGIAAQTERGASQLRRCAMVNVRLPIGVDDGTDETRQVHAKKVAEAKDNPDKTGEYPVVDVKSAEPLARWIEKELALKHNTMAVTFPLGPWMYMRMCAQIYLELEDFEWLANVMKGICKQVQHGEGPGGSELASEIEILEI